MADDLKQVKVDNWGIYFLQRLKHFFNRTDYCDLTLQFQDNAQLKVHRLVLSACTEYFELLERTCEMYEDCLVMPDDLQADIVVPIVNFMYTGQLEFKMDILDKLHQCSEIMNMPVLTKLLDSHRPKPKITQSYNVLKRPPKRLDGVKETIKSISATEIVTTAPVTYKRSHNKAFEKTTVYRDKKVYLPINKPTMVNNGGRTYREPSPIPFDPRFNKKVISSDPRPTRYELPEELDSENLFDSSFCNISYTSQPLMVHPETRKQYSKRPRLAGEASTSKKFGPTTVDIVQCKKVAKPHEDTLFEDSVPDDGEMFSEQYVSIKTESSRDPNQLFDQILERQDEAKVTVDAKHSKSTGNLDHAKIISEVLKKYPHLVKSNKNIKLKILNTPSKNVKRQKLSPAQGFEKPVKVEKESDYTFETDVLDSKQAARLIALGAENIDGPWICLICGAPGKAMNFTSYFKYRRHLVNVHNEKPVLNICEYCGQRSNKRNYLMHHMYTKHGVEPPPQYHFPKCNLCNYIALTEALLIRHKTSHADSKQFRCNVCPSEFQSSQQLLMHIQNTGHKYSADRKSNLQCIYCQKVFMREGNLYAHLKTHHSKEARRDGIIDDDDDEVQEKKNIIKTEPIVNDFEELDIQYQIQQRPDGNITVVPKKVSEPITPTKQKILNAGLSTQALTHKNKVGNSSINTQNEYIQEIHMTTSNDTQEEIVMIDNNEYIVKDNQLIPRRAKVLTGEFILSDHDLQSETPSTSVEFTQIHNDNVEENIENTDMLLKNTENLAQSIPIYVSNEEEYKAIMASNQPIIFDSNNSNKTLTVLSTPHSSTLETTAINLGAAQSNDMMIIQDEYPLNVSEAITSENSNIVVVYSHQVGNQNKQYQLLTTQALGAQFVQSSSIITQNYETVTTTAPILNADVLEKQVEEVWQNNIEQIVNTDQIEITPVPGLQSVIEQTNQEEITDNLQSSNDICDLPQVELPSSINNTSNNNANLVLSSQCQDIPAEELTTENFNENTEDDCKQTSTMEIIEEGPIEQSEDVAHKISSMEVIHEGPVGETEANIPNILTTMEVHEELIEETVDSTKPTLQNDAVIQEAEIIESQTYTQPDHMESQVYTKAEPNTVTAIENIEEVAEQQLPEELDNKRITSNSAGVVKKINEKELVTDSNSISDVSMDVEQILTEDCAEKVGTISSEWVEDTQENIPIKTTPNDSEQIINKQENTEPCELEESIENIQQEVDKQMATARQAQTEQDNEEEINDTTDSSQDESGQVQIKAVTMVTDPAVAQEKISSLLNDWEDNDSQEDNDSVTENVTTGPDDIVKTTVIETTAPDNPEKQDKIKSLVSDWDEDEEENKD